LKVRRTEFAGYAIAEKDLQKLIMEKASLNKKLKPAKFTAPAFR
jgi:hypothetical protein